MSNDVILGSTPASGAANIETLDQGGTGTTNATTAAGSTLTTNDTLHFASTPAFVALGMVVTDSTAPTVIPANSKVIAFTGTTVQLSAFVTGSGVGNGDTIVFAAQRQVIKAWMDSSQLFSPGPATAANSAPAVVQGQQDEAAAPSNNYPVRIAGWDGTNLRTLKTDTSGRPIIAGDTAAGASDGGNPVKVGGVGHTANPTAVTDGQRANFITDKLGKQVVVGSIRDLKVNTPTSLASTTSETTVLAQVASTFLDVYGAILTNGSATAVEVTFKDSTGGTTQFKIACPAGETRGFMLPESGAIKQATVNTNWTATPSASVTPLDVTMLAVKNT